MKFFTGTVTQGSADAFAVAEISTGLANVSNQAFRIRQIEFYVPALIGADSDIGVILQGKTGTALDFTGASFLAGVSKKMELTTSGMVSMEQWPNVQKFSRDEDYLIVEESVFLLVDSTGTSNSNSAVVRVGYETRSISATDRLTIQAARLA